MLIQYHFSNLESRQQNVKLFLREPLVHDFINTVTYSAWSLNVPPLQGSLLRGADSQGLRSGLSCGAASRL
jgi:hypothetical protein